MAGGGVGIAVATATALVALELGGCGDDDGDALPDRAHRGLLFRVPTEQMEPTLSFRQVVELDPDLDRIEVGDLSCSTRPRTPSSTDVRRSRSRVNPVRVVP